MKREIKFRAWDKDQKKMLYDITVLSQSPRYELMQYTGLKDSKGKEIYEGDIVKTESGSIGQVKWDEDIDTDRYWWIAVGFSIYILRSKGKEDMEKLEVIGNIYEHSQLLN